MGKLTDLSSERSGGHKVGSFQLRGEEVARLAKLLGGDMSRISELLGKDITSLSKLVGENMKMSTRVRLYPKTARLSKTWEQANCINASQFSAFFAQRVRRLRRLTNHEIVRSTIHRLAG